MSCPTWTWDVSVDVYRELLSEAKNAGVIFDGVKASFKDCEFIWTYGSASDPSDTTLAITCTKHPILASCGTIKNDLDKMIQASQKGASL